MDVVEAEELDHLGRRRDDGDGEAWLSGERGADAVLPGGEEVGIGGGCPGLSEGGGGEKGEEAEGESAANFEMHANFLAAGLSTMQTGRCSAMNQVEFCFELPVECRECGRG